MATVELPAALRGLCGGRARVRVQAQTVGAVLEALCDEVPALRDRLFTPGGEVRRSVGIFLGDEDVRSLGGLETPVGPRQVLVIVAAVAGG